MVVPCAVPDTEETQICLLEILRDGDGIARNLHDHRIVIRLSEGNRITVCIHVVVHGLWILDDAVGTETVDLGMAVYLHQAAAHGS